MKNNFEERRQNRIDHALNQAAKNKKKADSLYHQAKEMASVIPMGQPILVGHHSEKRDRNYRKKIDNKFGQSFEAEKKADYYEERAETIQNNDAIFSDDPLALDKLNAKLKALQEVQDFMKAANKCIRKKDKDAFLKLPFATDLLWIELSTPDYLNRQGFPAYRLQNNNANISRIKDRVAKLEKLANRQTTEIVICGVRIVANKEANRVQLFFPERLSKEDYKAIRRIGFIWCRSEGAFQRHLNNYAFGLAKDFVTKLFPVSDPEKSEGHDS